MSINGMDAGEMEAEVAKAQEGQGKGVFGGLAEGRLADDVL